MRSDQSLLMRALIGWLRDASSALRTGLREALFEDTEPLHLVIEAPTLGGRTPDSSSEESAAA